MELKAFKGMPHEFGGIDYTEGSEVEGGEFAVQIGKKGNEYIFDKNSSEGEMLSKEYKRLDKNGRLTEDDPLALETFDQIAREEALKHAQRSVNEKGIDPFRNMYDQAGQAANGGVKYATGGPMMNPAEVPNVNPGAQYNTSMSYAPMTMEDYNRQTQGESRMRDSFGTQAMREEPTQKAFKEIGAAKEAGLLIGDIFFGYPMASFTGKSFSETVMADQGYSSSDATKRAVGDDTMTGTAFGYGQMQSQNVISNMGGQVLGGMADGGAMPKDKYSMGGGMLGGVNTSLLTDMASTAGGAGGGVDGLLSNAGASGASAAGGGGGGMPWLQIVKAVKNVKDSTAQLAGSEMDKTIASKMGEEYITDKIGGPRQTMGGGSMAAPPKNKEQVEQEEVAFTGSGLDQQWMMDPNQTYAMPPASDTTSMVGTDVPIDLGIGTTGGSFDTFGSWRNGGAKPIYGYYANGGGKKANSNNAYEDYLIAKEKELAFKTATEGPYGINYSDVMYGPSSIEGRTDTRTEINNGNVNQSFNQVFENRNIGASSLSPGFDTRIETDGLNGQANQKFFTRNNATGDISTGINGITQFQNGGGKGYTDKIKEAERDFNKSLGRPMDKATRAYFNELYNNPRLEGDDMYLDPYRHGMAGYYTADAMRKKMPSWMPESVANKLAIAGSTIAGVGHEFAAPSTERMGLIDALTEAGQDAYNNYVGAKMIEDVLFDREAKQLMLDKIKREETYPGVVVSDTDPYVKRDNAFKFQNGGGKKEEDEGVTGIAGATGPTGSQGPTGIAVTPTGAAYSSDQMSLDNRGVGSLDFGIIPANVEQYFYTLLGGNKQFTEKDMTPEEYKALVKLYNLRKDSHTIGYPDHDKVGSTDIAKTGMLTKLTNEPDIIRNLIGAAAVKDGYITTDYNFGNKPLLEILKDPSIEDLMAWVHNNSPFVDSEAMAKKDAIKIKMPN
jgi:hypothetical protein